MDLDLLKKIPMFKGLAPPDFEKLASIIEEKSFVAGHKLFSTGDDADAFYIIKSGRAEALRDGGDDGPAAGLFVAGQCFGAVSLVDERESEVTLRCVEPMTVVAYRSEELEPLMSLPEMRAAIDQLQKEQLDEQST